VKNYIALQQTFPNFHASGPVGERAILCVDANRDKNRIKMHVLHYFFVVPVGGCAIFDDVQDHPRAMERIQIKKE